MTCSIRKAVQGDEQRICELFIEMLQTIYHTEDVQGYEPGYLDRYWKNGEDILFHVEKTNTSAFRLYDRLGYKIYRDDGNRYLMKRGEK